MAWDDGYRLLEARVRGLPDALRTGAAADRVPTRATANDAIVTTGIGSSAAHARFLAQVLSDRLPVPARFAAPSALLDPRPHAGARTLVVISQGLSPNARFLLQRRYEWRHVVVMTATSEDTARHAGDTAKADFLAELRETGVELRRFPAGDDEYTTLVRVVGPMAGYWCALRFVEALTGDNQLDIEMVCDALAGAPARLAALEPAFDPAWLEEQLALLVTGTHGELVHNLRYKVLEGMLLPEPPVWDLLQMAHGPFQQVYDRRATFLALTRPDAAHEEPLLARFERMLEPARHRLIRLPATLPGPLAVFEHEALLNELLLRYVAALRIDQTRWPGRGRDAPLYELGTETSGQLDPIVREPVLSRRLDRLTWVELERLLVAAPRTAVVALGSTEQHGPHLPLATDTLIAEALAERFCARIEEALQCPVMSLGCAPEHAAFSGTLDLGAATLRATLLAFVRSLRQHGFVRAFVFSAHGGNCSVLAEALPALREAATPMQVTAFTDLAALTAVLHETAAASSIRPGAAGHHAGEIETSILLALRPSAVRTGALAAGYVDATADAQSLFYPSVRNTTPSGTIGDPRGATSARGERYLEAWVELLVAAYRDAKNRQ